MKSKIIKILKIVSIVFAVILISYFLFSLLVRPSLDRDWNRDQEILAKVTFDENLISITNIRNINYRSTTDYDVQYYDKVFDLNELNSVWYMVEPFAGYGAGAAHTLVSFGFENGDYVSVSAEIRKEIGENFSPLKGLFRQYELVYVIADERDVIKLRSNYRKDEVFLYPVVTTKENMQKLFVSMLNRANKLATEPEFYNTLTSTCTTNIVSHANEIVPGRIPFSFKVLMPAYSDELAHKIGLIDNSIPLEDLRKKYNINERALKYAESPDFSKMIRE